MPTEPADGSTAFVIAASVLGLIAIGQVAAVAWFISTVEPAGGPMVETVADPVARHAAGDPSRPAHGEPEINRTHAVANIPTIDPASATPPPAEAQQADEIDEEVAIQNKAALFYLDKGMALRSEGDMQGALVHFNSAASLEKDHPRILYEFAITYEKMGLAGKATQFWKSIYGLGKVRGGDYFALADFRLKGQAPEVPDMDVNVDVDVDMDMDTPTKTNTNIDTATVGAAAPRQRRFLEIASAIVEPDDTVAEGERVVLNVLIKTASNAVVNPKYVHVRVDFYDLVNESLVDLTRAVPANRWVTQPVDWKEQAEELLEVTYFLPPQSDQEILDFGHRAYHGYVIKVFYRDELQDIAAEPAALLDGAENAAGAPAAPAPVADESFFPR